MSVTIKTYTFDDCWLIYPRKVAKVYSRKHWDKIKPSPAVSELIYRSIEVMLRTEWKGRKPDHIPHFATYLNQRRYMDEVETLDGAAETAVVVDEIEFPHTNHTHICRFCSDQHEWTHDDWLCYIGRELACPVYRGRLK